MRTARTAMRTKRHGVPITVNSDGSATVNGQRCKSFEAALRLADRLRRSARSTKNEQHHDY